MNGKTMLMEFRKSWKGFTIFLIIVVLIAGGMAQLFPTVSEAFEEDADEFEGQEFVEVQVYEDTIHLYWDEIEGAEEYIIIEDRNHYMVTSWEVNRTSINYTYIPHLEDKVRYFAVIGVMNDSSKIPRGMASTEEPRDPIQELMDTPFYRMFTAGRADITFDDIEGFLSLELYSWWILLVGVYLGYISIKSITEDYEEGRMDIIFSTPLSRRQYLLEKFFALSLFNLAMLFLSGLSLMFVVRSLSESNGTFLLISLVMSWPLFLVIIALSIFFSVLFKSSRMAVGATFGIILIQYALFMAGHMVESLESILPFTISYYWDYNSIILDNVISISNFLILMVLAILIFFSSILIFEKSDIPV
ncbi:MAG: ABC transporter permease [Thermoplasmatota archaeon]